MPKCKVCKQDIEWAKDPQTDKWFPLNPDGTPHKHKSKSETPTPPITSNLKYVIEYGETVPSDEKYGSRRYSLLYEFPQDGKANVDDSFNFVRTKVKAWISKDKKSKNKEERDPKQ